MNFLPGDRVLNRHPDGVHRGQTGTVLDRRSPVSYPDHVWVEWDGDSYATHLRPEYLELVRADETLSLVKEAVDALKGEMPLWLSDLPWPEGAEVRSTWRHARDAAQALDQVLRDPGPLLHEAAGKINV